MPFFLVLLEQEKPDIVLLQETKTVDKTFPTEAFPDYNCYFHGQPSYNGVAILVIKSIEIEAWEVLDFLPGHARCMRVKIAETWIYSVYVPCGEGAAIAAQNKTQFMQNLVQHFVDCGVQKTIIGGDFNVALTDRDVEFISKFAHTPICLPEFRTLMYALLDHGQLIDPYIQDAGHKNSFTWWHYFGYKMYLQALRNGCLYGDGSIFSGGLRIDYIFYSKALQADCAELPSFRILPSYRSISEHKPSDHVPIVLNVDINALR